MIEKRRELKALELERERLENEKPKEWRPPFKWVFRFNQSKRVVNRDKILVIMFNKKNQIEPPKLMPIYGNLIVYNNKVYKYHAKKIWTMLVMGKPQVYCIREKDMEPISNQDSKELEELMLVKGRSTEYHRLLLQAAIAAQTKKEGPGVNAWLIGGVILVVVVGLLWYFLKG